MRTKIEEKQKDAPQYLFLWLLVWGFVTPLGMLAGLIRWLCDMSDVLDDDEDMVTMGYENEGVCDVEEIERFNVDEKNNFNVANICYDDGPEAGEQFV